MPEAVTETITILNSKGLHARAAAKFVECVGRYKADVTVTKDQASVGGQSIMGLMMLAATPGSEIEISATGVEATSSLAALVELIQNKFDED